VRQAFVEASAPGVCFSCEERRSDVDLRRVICSSIWSLSTVPCYDVTGFGSPYGNAALRRTLSFMHVLAVACFETPRAFVSEPLPAVLIVFLNFH